MKIGVILSTYNSPAWLEKVLWGYEEQTHDAFELVIADDGSDDRTRQLIERFQCRGHLAIKHVWHPDDGFRKTEILNQALMATDADYLIFSDGDCIPRSDFVSVHDAHAQPQRFLSAGYYKMSLAVSRSLTESDIRGGAAFDADHLNKLGQPRSHRDLRLRVGASWGPWLSRLTPTAATWNGANSSGWRHDLLNAGGFDLRMKYGGEDRELGERLHNAGIRGLGIRYQAICLHLDHDRGYVTQEDWDRNNSIREQTRRSGRTRTEHGIDRLNNALDQVHAA